MRKEIKVKQSEEKPIPAEVMAECIKAISDGVKKLRAGPLNDKAIYLLIQHAAPSVGGRYNTKSLSIKEIKAVIECMESLEATYLKKRPK